MPKSVIYHGTRKSLFLICPTDNMEQIIKNGFAGNAYFYTALGVYFRFELEDQLNLWDIIKDNSIDQVVFVTSIDNRFYKEALRDKTKQHSPILQSLNKTKMKLPNYEMRATAITSNLHLLASYHLKDQIKRLLSTDYLGTFLRSEEVKVTACIYAPYRQQFCGLSEMEMKGHLINDICYN